MKLFYFNHNKFVDMPSMPATQIKFTELTFILDGEMEYIVNQSRLTLKKNDIFCLSGTNTRSRRPVKHCDYISFNFFPGDGDEPVNLPQIIKGGVTPEIRLLLFACSEIHGQMTDDKARLSLILQCLIKQIETNLAVNANSLTFKIKTYIYEHLYENVNLEDIARYTFFSAQHCAKVFRQNTGTSIINYAITEKMNIAKNKILEHYPLKQVAESLGFTDYNYFSRLFKKHVGYSPSQYKRLLFNTTT